MNLLAKNSPIMNTVKAAAPPDDDELMNLDALLYGHL